MESELLSTYNQKESVKLHGKKHEEKSKILQEQLSQYSSKVSQL